VAAGFVRRSLDIYFARLQGRTFPGIGKMVDIDNRMAPGSAVYKTLLESTKAIPWKIDWDS
jgi:hypothetical protein